MINACYEGNKKVYTGRVSQIQIIMKHKTLTSKLGAPLTKTYLVRLK